MRKSEPNSGGWAILHDQKNIDLGMRIRFIDIRQLMAELKMVDVLGQDQDVYCSWEKHG